ncbi:MAG: AMMECR1 domain-containing protein, partial [Gammaproteobacteria bacterium]
VWEQLPDKEEFLQNLLMKAGLPHNYWSDSIKIERYETICFGDSYSQINVTSI